MCESRFWHHPLLVLRAVYDCIVALCALRCVHRARRRQTVACSTFYFAVVLVVLLRLVLHFRGPQAPLFGARGGSG